MEWSDGIEFEAVDLIGWFGLTAADALEHVQSFIRLELSADQRRQVYLQVKNACRAHCCRGGELLGTVRDAMERKRGPVQVVILPGPLITGPTSHTLQLTRLTIDPGPALESRGDALSFALKQLGR